MTTLTLKEAKKELKLMKGRLAFMDNKQDRAQTLSDIEQLETYIKECRVHRNAQLISLGCAMAGLALNIGANVLGNKLINR